MTQFKNNLNLNTFDLVTSKCFLQTNTSPISFYVLKCLDLTFELNDYLLKFYNRFHVQNVAQEVGLLILSLAPQCFRKQR